MIKKKHPWWDFSPLAALHREMEAMGCRLRQVCSTVIGTEQYLSTLYTSFSAKEWKDIAQLGETD